MDGGRCSPVPRKDKRRFLGGFLQFLDDREKRNTGATPVQEAHQISMTVINAYVAWLNEVRVHFELISQRADR